MDSSEDFSSNAWKLIKEGADDVSDKPVIQDVTTFPDEKDSLDEESLDEEITSVFKDMKERLANDTSGQLKLGAKRFCQRYRMMSQQKVQ